LIIFWSKFIDWKCICFITLVIHGTILFSRMFENFPDPEWLILLLAKMALDSWQVAHQQRHVSLSLISKIIRIQILAKTHTKVGVQTSFGRSKKIVLMTGGNQIELIYIKTNKLPHTRVYLLYKVLRLLFSPFDLFFLYFFCVFFFCCG